MIVAIEILQALERGDDALERIAGVEKIKRMLQRRIAFMRRKNLNVAPGETHEIRLELNGRFSEHTLAFRPWVEGEIYDVLTNVRAAAMNKIGEVGDPGRVYLFTREKYVKDGGHGSELAAI